VAFRIRTCTAFAAFNRAKYHPHTTSFIIFLKKGKKQPMRFLDLDYYNYLQAELESAPFPARNIIPKYHQFTAPFSGLGILKRRATI